MTDRYASYTRQKKTVKTTREQAFAILERSDRTEQQLRQGLARKECPADEIDETIAFLKEYHYIDDADYAERYIRSYSSRKSVRQIRNDLLQRGISSDLIDAALEVQLVDEEKQIRSLLLKKGYCSGERTESDAYRRMAASLARRGYSFDAIRKAMDQMREEDA